MDAKSDLLQRHPKIFLAAIAATLISITVGINIYLNAVVMGVDIWHSF
jgi:hypothetical protein